MVFGNQSSATSSQTNGEAIYQAQHILEEARASSSHADFLDIISVPPASVSNDIFSRESKVLDISPCSKRVTAVITWKEGIRSLSTSLITMLTDSEEAIILGNDCASIPPAGGWNPPALFASDTINPGRFSTLDALQKIIYFGSDNHAPYFYIADTHSTVLHDDHNTNPSIVTFTNFFAMADPVNDLDTYKDMTSGKTFVFAATASATAQLAVIDVTDILNPVLVATRRLNGITATNSTSWGWRVYFYDRKLYITSRETAGPELHVFDISVPTNPVEVGSVELNTSVNDFSVRNGLAYFAAQSNIREMMIYNVSNPSSMTELAGARRNLPGNEDGVSLLLLGDKLYFGREKTASGPEFYIFDASSPATASVGLPIIGGSDSNKEMGTSITSIRVAGRYAFLATYANASGGFKVWDITNPSSIQSIYLSFNFGNKPVAIDYEPDFVYAGGESTPNFQILYSP